MTRTARLAPMTALPLVLAALLAGCARPDAAQAPRLLSPAEIAALTAEAEAAAPDEALAARAAALRARAAALRAGTGREDDALRRRAADLRAAGG